MRIFQMDKTTLNFTLWQQEKNYNRLHTNKISLLEDALAKPLQPEPKIKIEIPKPEPCEDPMKVEPDYECALDKLGQLDKQYKDKNFGFYGKYFRSTHGRTLNFYKYRKANPVGHPHARFEFDEENFLDSYVQMYFERPTMEEYFYGRPVVYGCDEQCLRVTNSEPQEQRSATAKALYDERKLQLRNIVADSGKGVRL